MKLLSRLYEIAPAVARWLRITSPARGPMPDVHPRHRAEVESVLKALRGDSR